MKSIVQKNLVNWFSKSITEDELSLNVVFVGRSGVGKTSTINSILNSVVAKVDKFQPATKEIMVYEHDFNDISLTINDTPGFCDDVPEKNNDANYVKLIKSKFKIPFCLVYVTELHAPRVSGDEKRTIQTITENLGKKIWERSVILFTHSDKEPPEDFQETLDMRTQLLREEIAKHIGEDETETIPNISISNIQEKLPNGELWKPAFYSSILNRLIIQPSLCHLKATYKA